MIQEAQAFLRRVTPDTGWITVIAIHPTSQKCVGRSLCRAQQDRADDFIEEHRQFNLYWSPNPQAKPLDKKPTKMDIASLRWLYVDVDDPSQQARDRLLNYRIPPTLVIFSGGGFQGFWELHPQEAVLSKDSVEACNRQLIIDLGGDKSAWNVDRIMRLPGTTNWPTKTKLAKGRVPIDAKVLLQVNERVYPLSAFKAAAPTPDAPAKKQKANGAHPVDRSAELLKKVARRVRSGARDEDIHNEFDATDPHALAQQDPVRAVQNAIDQAHSDRATVIEEMSSVDPADLWASLPPAPDLPRGILPKVVEELAFIKPAMFPSAALGASALAVTAMAISGNIKIEINATWRESAILWVGLMGPSSAAKTPTQKIAFSPLDEIQAEESRRYALELAAWKDHADEQAAKDKKHKEPARRKPESVRYVTTDATIEAIGEILKRTDHGIGLVNNELSSVIAAMDGAYKDKSQVDRGAWLALYDGGPYSSDRIGRGESYAPYFGGSILGGITTDKMTRVARDGVADGLLARFSLITMPVARPSDDLDAITGEVYDRYRELIRDLTFSRPPEIVKLKLTAEGRTLLGAAKKEWQQAAQHYTDSLPRYAERLGKLWGLAARVALVFAMIEAADLPSMSMHAIETPKEVTTEQMRRAIAWVKYQTQHDHNFYAMVAGCETVPTMVHARLVAGWILHKGIECFQMGDVTRNVFEWRALKSMEQMAAIDLLEQLSWCVVQTPDGGPPFRGMTFVRGAQWVVNSRAHEVYAERAAYEMKRAQDAYELLQAAIRDRVAGVTN